MKYYQVPSESNPNKVYLVRDLEEKGLRCNCADFIFREKIKPICKHIAKIKSEQNEAKSGIIK